MSQDQPKTRLGTVNFGRTAVIATRSGSSQGGRTSDSPSVARLSLADGSETIDFREHEVLRPRNFQPSMRNVQFRFSRITRTGAAIG